MMKRIALMLAVAMLVVTPMRSFAEVVRYGTMMVDHCEEWVSLRDGPGTGCGRLAKVPLYALVTDAQWGPICGDFIYCCYDGQYGYILARYLEPWADPEPDDDPDREAAPVRADWAEATKNLLVVDEDGEYVTIMADEPVFDVELLALELSGVDEDGNVTFETTVLHEHGAIDPDSPFVLRIAFPGDIPSYGIRLTDGSGAVRQFALGISGRDGSLVLSEF